MTAHMVAIGAPIGTQENTMEELDVIGVYLGYLGLEALAGFVVNVVLQIVKILILISPIFIWLHLRGIRAAEEQRNLQFGEIKEALQDICTALEEINVKEE